MIGLKFGHGTSITGHFHVLRSKNVRVKVASELTSQLKTSSQNSEAIQENNYPEI
jgi:hypothetical protein